LVRAALDRECDGVLAVEPTLAPDAVAALRRNRIPVALWYPDCVANVGRMRMLTAPYSAMFFKDPLLVRRLEAMLDLPVGYLPEACNPRWHRPIGDAGADPSIVVVGNIYPSRLMVLRRLHAAGIPLVIYGGPAPRWLRDLLPPGLHTGRAVFREKKSQVFRGAAGVLNNLHPAEMEGVNCRLFEAAGAGAAVLCERRPTLAELFDTDREVVPFSDFSELLEQARRLLADARSTAEIGDAASKRAHAEHTYEHRLATILEWLT
jgi:spore maturation protein CgeB